ncbi:hypothetical protein [Glaciimonas soli]|uniref:Uncharacterized protein n=1 Tax=Glaciimonas soli TaxID=2590999 RepID=A0A843YXA3_9BURK|nr:hypothetical protein [Glaciimonas soli]MQR01186.1 hypothetical protein [Glaciimonas soli]
MKINQLLATAVVAAFALPAIAQNTVTNAVGAATGNAVTTGKAAVGTAVDNVKQGATNAMSNHVTSQTTTTVQATQADTGDMSSAAPAASDTMKPVATGKTSSGMHGAHHAKGKKRYCGKYHGKPVYRYSCKPTHHGKKHYKQHTHTAYHAHYHPVVHQAVVAEPVMAVVPVAPVQPVYEQRETTKFIEGHPVLDPYIVQPEVRHHYYLRDIYNGA